MNSFIPPVAFTKELRWLQHAKMFPANIIGYIFDMLYCFTSNCRDSPLFLVIVLSFSYDIADGD